MALKEMLKHELTTRWSLKLKEIIFGRRHRASPHVVITRATPNFRLNLLSTTEPASSYRVFFRLLSRQTPRRAAMSVGIKIEL